MAISWGYSPKSEKFIPLTDFPSDRYLIIVRQAIENLGWHISYVSEEGIIAYTPLSFQSYSEEISVRIENNFALVKSECVGIQLLYNDYGKNGDNLEKLFHEFDYVQYHLQNQWDEQVLAFHAFAKTQDPNYFAKAPLAIKNKIKNVLYLFWPRAGFVITPIVLWLNLLLLLGLYFALPFLISLKTGSASIAVQNVLAIVKLGAVSRDDIFRGEYWRLFSYQFLHSSFSHLFSNMYAFVYIGLLIENKLGWKNYLLIYLVSGICGGLASIAYHEEVSTIGASGAIMGLFGALLALLLNRFFEAKATKALLTSTVLVLAIMLVNGSIAASVNNMCHLGGLIAGFVCTYLLTANYSKLAAGKQILLKYGLVITMVLVCFLATLKYTPRYQHKQFEELSRSYFRNIGQLYRVVAMKGSTSGVAQEQLVLKYAIVSSRANLALVKQMDSLTLNDKFELDRSLKTKLAKQHKELALLMLKDVRANHQYRKEVNNKLTEFIATRNKLRDSLNKY